MLRTYSLRSLSLHTLFVPACLLAYILIVAVTTEHTTLAKATLGLVFRVMTAIAEGRPSKPGPLTYNG
jgi:hypothetical protein